MKLFPSSRAGLGALAVLCLSTSASAHSWIEKAYRIDAATRKFIGAPGYPRGGNYRRLAAEGASNDEKQTYRLPSDGIYTGDEILNSGPIAPNRPDETLEAFPGDYIALLHTENGHVTEKQEGRPLNGGTVYLYGTSEPKDEEKLFDVHLVWNKDGTGGDGRGRLLGTRNYDDSQCYEGNAAKQFAVERSAAVHGLASESLPCQSDIQLPEDLKPGTNYTVYWYWEYPNLNTAEIDMEGTKEGLFPWMGTFVKGEKDPHGFTEAALQTNESYASTIDIKIVDKSTFSVAKAVPEVDLTSKPQVYGMAIDQQLKDGGFAVNIDPSQGGGDSNQPPASSPMASSTAPTPTDAPQGDGDGLVTVTVTATKTVEPQEPSSPPSPTTPCKSTSTQTVVEMETSYLTVYPEETATEEAGNQVPAPTSTPTTMVTLTTALAATSTLPKGLTSYFVDSTATPVPLNRRTKWSFGEY